MNVFSLFSGVGGLDEGLRRAGFHHVLLCEADPWRRDVLRVRFPGVPVADDVRAVGVEPAAGAAADGRGAVADGAGRLHAVAVSGDTHARTHEKDPHPCSLTSSQEDSPAKTSPSPDNAADSPANAPASSSNTHASSTLFDPDGYSSRTFQVSSLRTAVGTSESCLERWPTSGTAWHGGFSTHVSSECRSADGVCSSSEPALTEILQPPHTVPARYSLSARAANGILRRAEKRGRTIPASLLQALSAVAAASPATTLIGGRTSLSGLGNGGPDDNDAQVGRLLVTGALTSSVGQLDDQDVRRIVAFHPTGGGRKDLAPNDEVAPGTGTGTGTGTGGTVAIATDIGVRRLTPTECERLQGLPDGWTDLGDTPDSRRYSALGDAVTATVAHWLGDRIRKADAA